MQEVGYSAVELDGRFSTVRTRESNLGNFVTDIWKEDAKADVALLNSGSLRSDTLHPPGPIKTQVHVALFIWGARDPHRFRVSSLRHPPPFRAHHDAGTRGPLDFWVHVALLNLGSVGFDTLHPPGPSTRRCTCSTPHGCGGSRHAPSISIHPRYFHVRYSANGRGSVLRCIALDLPAPLCRVDQNADT